MAFLKTVKKWEEILKCKLGKEMDGNKVTKMKCKVCIKHEQNIIKMKGFSKSWINSTASAKKDLENHVKGDPHLHAVELEEKQELGADTYNQEVVSSLPKGRGLANMAEKYKQTLIVRFNTAYYLAKSERPYSEFGELLTLQEKIE